MEVTLRDSSKAFKEISLVTVAWLKDTHQSLQRQETRWERVKQEVQDQETEIQTLTVDIRCVQNSYELQEERLKRLEGIVRKQEQALLTQGRRWEGAGKGEQRTGVCPAAKAVGPRVYAGEPCNVRTSPDSSKSSTGETTTPERVKGSLEGSPGIWQLPPQPRDL